MKAALYGKLYEALWGKEINYLSDDIRVQLHSSSYTPSQATHKYRSDLTNELATTGGYTAGGQALTGKTVTYTAGTRLFTLDCNDPAWAASTITARYAVVLDATPGTDATRPLICYENFETDQSTTAGTFTLVVNAAGLVQETVGAEA
jgi:hypothetical protein